MSKRTMFICFGCTMVVGAAALGLRTAAAGDPRATIVMAAATALGDADDCVWDQADPNNPSRSSGADCLLGIANEAFGGAAPASVRSAVTQKGPRDGGHWCGMFALGAIKQGVPTVGNWVVGSGISSVAGMRQITRAQLGPGDVCYLGGPFQHHALVVEVNGPTGAFTTIEGNADCNGHASTICEKSHTSCANYYSAF